MVYLVYSLGGSQSQVWAAPLLQASAEEDGGETITMS